MSDSGRLLAASAFADCTCRVTDKAGLKVHSMPYAKIASFSAREWSQLITIPYTEHQSWLETQQALAIAWLETAQIAASNADSETPCDCFSWYAPVADAMLAVELQLEPWFERWDGKYTPGVLRVALTHAKRHAVLCSCGMEPQWALVPILGPATASATRNAGARLELEDGTFHVIAGAAGLSARDHISRFFGRMSNDGLVVNHGLCMANNPLEQFELHGLASALVECQQPVFAKRLAQMALGGIQDKATFLVPSKQPRTGQRWVPGGVCSVQTMAACRGLMSAQCLDIAALWRPLAASAELAVWRALLCVCEQCICQLQQVSASAAGCNGCRCSLSASLQQSKIELLSDAAAALRSCIRASEGDECVALLRLPDGSSMIELSWSMPQNLDVGGCLSHEFQAQAQAMPDIVRQLLLHSTAVEAVNPQVLLRALMLPKRAYLGACSALQQSADEILWQRPQLLSSGSCAKLREMCDMHPCTNADSVDGAPEHQRSLGWEELRVAVGAAELHALQQLPQQFMLHRIGKLRECQMSGMCVRRYSAATRPWIPFHCDKAAVTVNVALSSDTSHSGRLLAAFDHRIWSLPRAEGDALVHESSLLHGVSQVTTGIRYSLIAFFDYAND